MTTGAPFYSVILPAAGTNAVTNPSAEFGATGWSGTAGGTATRQAGTAAFGAWAVAGTVGAAAGTGILFGTLNQAAGSYTVSAWVYGGSGSVYSIGIKGTGAGGAFVGSVAGTTGGTWHRYSFSYGEASPNLRFFSVINRSAGGAPFLVDAVQVEGGTFLTTYIDGAQDGCTWLGQPHASASSRSGTSRQGGTVVTLQSLGMTVMEAGGVGMPPVDNITQEYAIADGAFFQRQRATSRPFTLTGLFSGSTWQGLHAVRRNVIDALKIDLTPNPQPTRFLYTGAGGTSVIDAYYDGGLTMESREGFTETAGVRMLAVDPYWYSLTDEGTALTSAVALGSTNFIAARDPQGRWGTLGVSGTTTANFFAQQGIRAIQPGVDGTVYIGGDFQTIGGTFANGVGMWLGNAGRFGTLAGGTLHVSVGTPIVTSLAVSPAGSVFVAGQWDQTAGTSSGNIAQWNGAWGSLAGGTVGGGFVQSLLYAPNGTLFFGLGNFNSVGGTATQGVAMWGGASFGTLTGGTVIGGNTFTMTWSGGRLYVGGTAAGGTAAGHSVYTWNGAWGTTNGSIFGPIVGSAVYALTTGPDGAVYAGGVFTTFGGGTVNGIAKWNGAQYTALSVGVGSAINSNVYGEVWRVQALPDNSLYAAGRFRMAGSVALPDALARWNGAAWIPGDVDLPNGNLSGAPIIWVLAVGATGTLYVGGGFFGTALAAGVTTVVNDGAANAYPAIVMRNPTASSQRLYQVLNTATNDGVWLNTDILPGETITLDLRTTNKTLTSDYRGNILGAVLPGSNLTTWRLAPGTNFVSVFAASGSVETSIYWRNRAWSADPRL